VFGLGGELAGAGGHGVDLATPVPFLSMLPSPSLKAAARRRWRRRRDQCTSGKRLPVRPQGVAQTLECLPRAGDELDDRAGHGEPGVDTLVVGATRPLRIFDGTEKHPGTAR
jgi:hypothetical protein